MPLLPQVFAIRPYFACRLDHHRIRNPVCQEPSGSNESGAFCSQAKRGQAKRQPILAAYARTTMLALLARGKHVNIRKQGRSWKSLVLETRNSCEWLPRNESVIKTRNERLGAACSSEHPHTFQGNKRTTIGYTELDKHSANKLFMKEPYVNEHDLGKHADAASTG